MNIRVMAMCAAFGVSSVGCSKGADVAKPAGTPPMGTARAVAGAAPRQCPGVIPVAKNPRPQNAAYRGDCLDTVIRIEGKLDPENPTLGRVHAFAEAGRTFDLLVEDAHKQDTSPRGGPIKLLRVTLPTGEDLCAGAKYPPTSWERSNVCDGGDCSALNYTAIAVPGYWQNGKYHPANDPASPTYSLSCISGVIAKCVHWGYVPWRKRPNDESRTLEEYYMACVHAARANYDQAFIDDYHSFTCQDTEIDIYDSQNIQPKRDRNVTIESLWTKDGLLQLTDKTHCLHHTRYRNCDGDLTRAKVSLNPACKDPGRVDGDWTPILGEEAALIAVASRTDLSLPAPDGCPRSTKNEAACPNR